MSEFRHCRHTFEDGHTCGSAAVTGREYCYHHLNHRGRRIRIFRARAQNRQVHLDLPPLDCLSTVHSVANQIVQALAAGVIDIRNAKAILSFLRFVAQNLKHAGTPAWNNTAYQNEQPMSYDAFESKFGLPENFDLDTTPQSLGDAPSVNGPQLPGAPPFSTAAADERVDSDDWPSPTHNPLPEMPFSGNYCGDHHSRECECLRIRADYPVTPEMIEYLETSETYGPEVAAVRNKQLLRNADRRRLNRERKRYQAVAIEKNMLRAAEKMAARILDQRAKDNQPPAELMPKPPVSVRESDQVEMAKSSP